MPISQKKASRDMSDTWRLFIAIELSDAVVSFLSETLATLERQAPRRAVRWVKPESTHLTIKFLGDVPVTQRDELQRALEHAVRNHPAFELATDQLGCFPHSRQPRVVWVGLQHNLGALQELRDAVEQDIAPLGYPTENRPYHPHLTLGRVQRNANRNHIQQLGQLIDATTLKNTVQWPVNRVTLFRSELGPQGARYTPLFHAPLQRRDRA